MKIKPITTIAAIALLPIAGFAQTPPVPPAPPSQPGLPAPPGPPDRHERAPKVPVIFLGVETSEIPSVLCEQMNLPKGFGLVVDYVVPNGPAAAAGVQQNDILKMLNEQILINPSQLRKLLQSFQDGQTVTLTVIRKGQEQKISVKLTKKEVAKRHAMHFGHDWNPDFDFDFDFDFDKDGFQFDNVDFGNVDLGNLKERLQDLKLQLKEQIGDQKGVIHEAVMKATEEARRARDEARRAGEEARRANGIKVIRSQENGALRTTKIDMDKAQIVFSDDKGEMKLETVDGKKLLTVKDPQGKLLFSGPIETKEELDKVPGEIRQRYEQLKEKDLPAVAPRADPDEEESSDADDEDEEESVSMEQV
jgi:serine protease Do